MNKNRLLVAVVDDEEAVRMALWRLLRSASFNGETFSWTMKNLHGDEGAE